jgi:hypothetical protein
MPPVMDSMMHNVPSSAIPIPGGEDQRAAVGDHQRYSRATSPPESEIGGHSGGNASSVGPGSGRQRRPRSRRDKDKRYTCDSPGCDKSYTRAEHLTRHQLNRKAPPPAALSSPSSGRLFCRGSFGALFSNRYFV